LIYNQLGLRDRIFFYDARATGEVNILRCKNALTLFSYSYSMIIEGKYLIKVADVRC